MNVPSLHYYLFCALGKNYMDLDSNDLAKEYLIFAQELKPEEAEAFNLLAYSFHKDNKKEKACNIIKNSIKLNITIADSLKNTCD